MPQHLLFAPTQYSSARDERRIRSNYSFLHSMRTKITLNRDHIDMWLNEEPQFCILRVSFALYHFHFGGFRLTHQRYVASFHLRRMSGSVLNYYNYCPS